MYHPLGGWGIKSYSAYFFRTGDAEGLRQALGRMASRSLQTVEGSPWLVWNYNPDGSPPDDDVLWGRASVTEARSANGREVIYLFADTSIDGFVYEHAQDGVLLRKLVFYPLLDDGTAGWLCAHGDPEAWETHLFRPARLAEALEEERERLQEGGRSAPLAEHEVEIRRLFAEGAVVPGRRIPRCDGTIALRVEEHFGLRRPAR